jgi:hypothetical protein
VNHREHVDAWLGVGFARLPHDQKVAALERAFSAMWIRARATLGEVTLAAIGERVLVQARDTYPFLAGVTVERDGLRCDPLLREHAEPPTAAMDEAVRRLLVDLLTLLGNLTAEIMTPALHDALDRTPSPKPKAKPKPERKPKAKAKPKPKPKPKKKSSSRGKTK